MVSHHPVTMENKFDLRAVHMGFMVDMMALGQFFLSHLVFPISIFPLMFHTHVSFTYHQCYIILETDSFIKQNTKPKQCTLTVKSLYINC